MDKVKTEDLNFYLAMGEQPDSSSIPYELVSREEQRHRDINELLRQISNHTEETKIQLSDINDQLYSQLERTNDILHRSEVFLNFIADMQKHSYSGILWIIVALQLVICYRLIF